MYKTLISQRFAKAIPTYPHEACVQQQIAERMIHLLQQHLPGDSPGNIVEFGCGTGNYSRLLQRSFRPARLLLNDLCPEMQSCCNDLIRQGASFIAGDAEALLFPAGTDLITSCSTLQWFDCPEHFFRHCHSSLRPGGYFAISTFGEDNIHEVRKLTGNGLPYRSLPTLLAALTPLYDILHSEEEIITSSFSSPLKVLHHMKQTGVTGTGEHRWTRGELDRFCMEYTRLFGNGLSVSLTYHPIYIIAKKKQQ